MCFAAGIKNPRNHFEFSFETNPFGDYATQA